MSLQEVADVQIDRQTAAVTRVGFGTLLFINESGPAIASVVREYRDIDEVGEDYAPDTPTFLAALSYFSQEFRPDRLKVAHKSDTQTYVEVIGDAEDADDDWYALAIESRIASDIQAVAANIQARQKIFLAVTADADVLDPTDTNDIGSFLLSNSYSRTALWFESDGDWIETGIAGLALPKDPGTLTWANNTVAGVVGRRYSGSAISALQDKRVSYYSEIAGINATQGGFTSDSGAFIDLIRGIDWLRQTMAEDVWQLLARVDKISYTNAGIAQVEGVIRNRLQIAVDRDVVAPNPPFEVSVLDVLDTEENDRANRLLRDVNFNCRMAGAIHKVVVRGTVTV